MEILSYTILSGDQILDNPNRRYVLKIRDLPREKKPRERLLRHGSDTLTSAELLAVLLHTGTTKEEVMTMSERVLKEYGDRGVVEQRDAEKMARDLDIPVGKALQIVACMELGRRFFARNALGSPVLRTPQEVYAHTKDMARLPKEHLRGIYLNSHYKVIHEEVLSIGSVDANLIHPREVFKPALEYSAAAVILVHNHPSGENDPSDADVAITEQLVRAGALLGVALIDHLIVTHNGFQSVPAAYHTNTHEL